MLKNELIPFEVFESGGVWICIIVAKDKADANKHLEKYYGEYFPLELVVDFSSRVNEKIFVNEDGESESFFEWIKEENISSGWIFENVNIYKEISL